MSTSYKKQFTTINHHAQERLGLSLVEYCFLDLVYFRQRDPNGDGWSSESVKSQSEHIGMSERSVRYIKKRLESKNLLEIDTIRNKCRVKKSWWTETEARENSHHPPPAKIAGDCKNCRGGCKNCQHTLQNLPTEKDLRERTKEKDNTTPLTPQNENSTSELFDETEIAPNGALSSDARRVGDNLKPKKQKRTAANVELFHQLKTMLGHGDRFDFSVKRKRKLSSCLKRFTPDELVRAAKMMLRDDYLCGENPSRKRYLDFDFLVRDEDKISKYIDQYHLDDVVERSLGWIEKNNGDTKDAINFVCKAIGFKVLNEEDRKTEFNKFLKIVQSGAYNSYPLTELVEHTRGAIRYRTKKANRT